MRRSIALVLLLLLFFHPLWADTYEPYSADEFPQWSIKLRRAETLMFGSLPITFAFTGISYSVARSFGAQQFSADPIRESLTLFGIAGVMSVAIALADFIIGEMQD